VFKRLNLNFLNIFEENPEISNLMKIRLVGAELFHTDRRTDMAKLIVASFAILRTRLKYLPAIFSDLCKYLEFACSLSLFISLKTFFMRHSTTTVLLQTTSTDLTDGSDELFQCPVRLHLKTDFFSSDIASKVERYDGTVYTL
jgi:hypothetical protein